jgi:hypothetical protein
VNFFSALVNARTNGPKDYWLGFFEFVLAPLGLFLYQELENKEIKKSMVLGKKVGLAA